MNIPVFSADKWNAWADQIRRAWPFPGRNTRLAYLNESGVVAAAQFGDLWAHPWQLSPAYEYRPAEKPGEQPQGEWRAYVNPGFVNGRDAYITQTIDDEEKDVALTDDPAPFLVLGGWRNPAGSAGVSATESGEIAAAPAEGYPAFFATLGVKPAARGGPEVLAPPDDTRTREIRAVDVILTKPRLGSLLTVEPQSVIGDAQTHELSVTFQNSFYVATGGRPKLSVVSKYFPLSDQWANSPFLGLPMNAGDPQFDRLKIATVYLISPPDVDPDAEPDETWTAYPKHSLFWNVWHGVRFIPPATPQPPVRLVTGLGAGVLDTLADAMLAPSNSGLGEVGAFLNQADMRGHFWTIP